MDAELIAWLKLIRTSGVGSKTILGLLKHLPSSQAIIDSSDKTLAQMGMTTRGISALRAVTDNHIDDDLAWLEQKNNHLIAITDPKYPELLKEIDDPPAVLFCKGDTELLAYPQLAIVGSRNPSAGGVRNCLSFARHLAKHGLGITSGLAEGIDSAAHRGALEVNGITIAILASGLDTVYPAKNRDLAQQISQSGVLISEFPIGTLPKAGHFPRRNRIISGISIGTLVVEAAERSGSLITARLAAEQGREVFSIPGSIHNPMARGCHQLIRGGATLIEKSQDIISELGALLPAKMLNGEISSQTEPELSTEHNEHHHFLEQLGFDPVNIEEIIHITGLTPEEVSSILLILELEGHIVSLPGNRYARIRPNS